MPLGAGVIENRLGLSCAKLRTSLVCQTPEPSLSTRMEEDLKYIVWKTTTISANYVRIKLYTENKIIRLLNYGYSSEEDNKIMIWKTIS